MTERTDVFLMRSEINQRMSRLNTNTQTYPFKKNTAGAIPANEQQSVHEGTTSSFIFCLNAPEGIIVQTHLLDVKFKSYVWMN